MRQVAVEDEYTHVFVSAWLADNRVFYSNKGIMSLSPLWVRAGKGELLSGTDRAGILPSALAQLGFASSASEHNERNTSRDVLNAAFSYVYAQLHSPMYRQRYGRLLRIQYPRVFAARTPELRDHLAHLGAELVAMHLLNPDATMCMRHQGSAANRHNLPIVAFEDDNDREVRKVGERGKTMAPSPKGPGFGRVYINDTAYFDGVPEAVWKFHIGGYQVCHKWLADRKGRTLTDDDIAHYQKIVIALNETIRIMGEIDKVIEEHGGWPGAFLTERSDG